MLKRRGSRKRKKKGSDSRNCNKQHQVLWPILLPQIPQVEVANVAKARQEIGQIVVIL